MSSAIRHRSRLGLTLCCSCVLVRVFCCQRVPGVAWGVEAVRRHTPPPPACGAMLGQRSGRGPCTGLDGSLYRFVFATARTRIPLCCVPRLGASSATAGPVPASQQQASRGRWAVVSNLSKTGRRLVMSVSVSVSVLICLSVSACFHPTAAGTSCHITPSFLQIHCFYLASVLGHSCIQYHQTFYIPVRPARPLLPPPPPSRPIPLRIVRCRRRIRTFAVRWRYVRSIGVRQSSVRSRGRRGCFYD